jgi:translation initiation factor 2 beta subunit (eIF-2beta)/eIF-5
MKNIHKINQQIYITSDEEIKEGDWSLNTQQNIIAKCIHIEELSNGYYNGKKIILTTDQDLIKDGVQPIDDEFLEWFVKNPSCEEVEVKYERRNWKEINWITVYKIIIPKAEQYCNKTFKK